MPLNPLIKIIVADDHAIFRKGVKSIIATLKKEGLLLIGEAKNGNEAVNEIERLQPDVVLMDIEMPIMNGIEATALIKSKYPHVHTIAISYSDDNSKVFAMVEAGADGYLLKDTSSDELAHAIRTVYQGYSYFTPAITLLLTRKIKVGRGNAAADKKKDLTKRETEILQLLCDGGSSKEIADLLCVSKRTIDCFRDKIIKKTGVKNTLQLLRYAIREKLVNA
jgi:DNA-binding NarL/FixJ family response regulator